MGSAHFSTGIGQPGRGLTVMFLLSQTPCGFGLLVAPGLGAAPEMQCHALPMSSATLEAALTIQSLSTTVFQRPKSFAQYIN